MRWWLRCTRCILGNDVFSVYCSPVGVGAGSHDKKMGCVQSQEHGHGATASWTTTPALTATQLETLRVEFWDTRVEGHFEVWQAIKAGLEANDRWLERQILEAAAVTGGATTGTGVARNDRIYYDERGHSYNVPMFITSKPRNLDTTPACSNLQQARYALAQLDL